MFGLGGQTRTCLRASAVLVGVARVGRWATGAIRRRTHGYVVLLTYQGFPTTSFYTQL